MSVAGINCDAFAEHISRMHFCGVPREATDTLLRRMPEPTWAAWSLGCERLGDELRAYNPEAAMACLHFAQFKSHDLAHKRRLQAGVRALHGDVAAASGLAVVRIEVRYRGLFYPALLVEVPGSERNDRPCSTAFLLNGLDSVKEVELWAFAKEFIRRGVSRCLLVDGPGQGEARVERGRELDDFGGMAAVAAEAVRAAGRPCSYPLLFGASLGGFLAFKAAQHVAGLGATLCFTCGTDWDHMLRLPAELQLLFRFALALPAHEDMAPALAGVLKLDEERPPRCPVLILHGTRDRVMPVTGSRLLARRHPARVTLIEYDDGHMFLRHLGKTIATALDWAFLKARDTQRLPGREISV